MANMSEWDLNMPEYFRTYNNRQGTEYVSYNIQSEGILQVNEYLLRDEYLMSTYCSKI